MILRLLKYRASSGIQFFVLPSVIREWNTKILDFLYLLQSRSIHLQRALIRVSWKMYYLSLVVPVFIFYFGGVTCIWKAI